MNIYFEKLAVGNLAVAFIALMKGHRVCYFELGRGLRRLPVLGGLLLKLFHKATYQLSESPGLTFEVHDLALEAAEELYQQLIQHSGGLIATWGKIFKSQRVHLYIKKMVAVESFNLIRDYSVLYYRATKGDPPARLVVLDIPLNRLLLPVILRRYPDSRIEVRGLSRFPWRYHQGTLYTIATTLEYVARLLLSVGRRGFALRSKVHRCKVSKEINWGIGTGTGRRSDDFIVDGSLFLPEDMLFYYRRSSSARLPRPEFLQVSRNQAKAKGYRCVNFDRTPIPLSVLKHVVVPRYVVFPISMGMRALTGQVSGPLSGLLNHIVTTFSSQAVEWEVFLSSHAPRLNLSQDDPQPSHIAATVALNLHGAQNGGFQWADTTQWRSVTLAYVSYNVYFAWGPFVEKYWQGSWAVDRIYHTGYLWGHHFRESLEKREELRKALLGDDQRFLVALLDESASPDTYTSEAMVYDFYRVGVELLERRPDIVIVAKPKRGKLPASPGVMELLAPALASGRLKVWDDMTMDLWHLLAASDVVVSMVMGVPYLEAICCGRAGFNYAPSRNCTPIYNGGYGKVIFDTVGSLQQAIQQALDHPQADPAVGLEGIIDDVDPYRDCRGIDRMRSFVHQMTASDLQVEGQEPVAVTHHLRGS